MNILALLNSHTVTVCGHTAHSETTAITNIQYDSRAVTEGSLFVAIKGFESDGHDYIQSAIEKGAVAILSEQEPQECSVPWVKCENVRQTMADLSVTLYGINFDEIVMIGVTGTNGKTTVATLFDSLLADYYGREKCWQFGTIENRIGSITEIAQRTTPEAVDLLRMIGTATIKPSVIVMEVSSHALILERVRGYHFDLALFTNLTQDHLDFHKTMDEYYEAKRLLFTEHLKPTGSAIVNVDDAYGIQLARELRELGQRVVGYGKKQGADFRVVNSFCSWDKTTFRATQGDESYKIEAPVVGNFNIANISAIVAGALTLTSLKDEKEYMLKRIRKMSTVRGRMERVAIDAPFAVLVDYAHTPDALRSSIETARQLTERRVLVLFGAGGDRDRSKRPLMGAVVARAADYAIVTSDNPRSEEPNKIIADICSGIPTDFPYERVVDRAKAIGEILRFANAGDAVIIAGKGHETYQEVLGKRTHFDDAEIVEQFWNREVE